jgi:hypothetical protein
MPIVRSFFGTMAQVATCKARRNGSAGWRKVHGCGTLRVPSTIIGGVQRSRKCLRTKPATSSASRISAALTGCCHRKVQARSGSGTSVTGNSPPQREHDLASSPASLAQVAHCFDVCRLRYDSILQRYHSKATASRQESLPVRTATKHGIPRAPIRSQGPVAVLRHARRRTLAVPGDTPRHPTVRHCGASAWRRWSLQQ